MTTHARRLWYLPAIIAAALFLGGPLAAMTELVPPLKGFAVFAASGLAAAVALIWGLWLLLARGDAAGRRRGVLTLVAAVVPLATLGWGLAIGLRLPAINDISTDLDNPPEFVTARQAPENLGKDLDYPEDFTALVREAYPDLLSKQLPLAPEAAFARVKAAAERMSGWTIHRIDDATMTLEGAQTSRVFRFIDDFVIRVEPLDAGAQVDMRSRSRLGKGDFGVNAGRIRSFFGTLDAAADASR